LWRDEVRGVFYIALKDLRTYYLKPPSISWGIVFPFSWILAFYLRNPQNFENLIPGLLGMTILFSTTAAEAVVINFEMRLGSLERLLLTPISPTAVLVGKVMGGTVFGSLMTAVVATASVFTLSLYTINVPYLVLISLPSLLVFASLGALLCVLVKEVFEAQTLLNLPRFLMVFLCGVVYPVSAMPGWLQTVSYLMPLTYTIDGLRSSFQGVEGGTVFSDAMILAIYFVAFILPSIQLLKRRFR
jgi:ABC-2 type transport system permease protein